MQVRSSGRMPNTMATAMPCMTELLCEITAPLGREVVPEV